MRAEDLTPLPDCKLVKEKNEEISLLSNSGSSSGHRSCGGPGNNGDINGTPPCPIKAAGATASFQYNGGKWALLNSSGQSQPSLSSPPLLQPP